MKRNRKRVTLEPDLEEFAGDLTAEDCYRLACRYYRFAKALWRTWAILREADPLAPKHCNRRRRRFHPRSWFR